MKLENQVCSLELAKKLKELGFSQESVWYYSWHKTDNPPMPQLDTDFKNVPNEFFDRANFVKVAAFTCAELGEMLQDYSGNVEYDGKFKKWRIIYFESSYTTEIIGSEADARAKLLIYLLENKLLDKPKLKED